MSYLSFTFILFLLLTLLSYYAMPARWKQVVLLIGSIVFYTLWDVKNTVVLLSITLVSFLIAKQIEQAEHKNTKKKYLIAGLAISIFALFIFKYETFFLDTIQSSIHWFHLQLNLPSLNLVVPLGISFFTLQVIGYLIDVYKGTIKAEKNLWTYALFITYFPQIVSGPINRAKTLIPQLRGQKEFDENLFFEGARQILWGLFQKFVIVVHLKTEVDLVYNNLTEYSESGLPFIIATYFFAFQIYCDFAGYSNITIGIAKLFGHKLAINFRQPYFAKNFNDFWNRWHISLSNWLRDYVFIPLTRNIKRNKGLPGWIAFIVSPVMTMLISGLWHGANWNFVVWGLIHGVYLLFSNILEWGVQRFFALVRLEKCVKIRNFIQSFIIFHAVTLAWIYFKTNDLHETHYILKRLFLFNRSYPRQDYTSLILAIICVLVLIVSDIIQASAIKEKFHTLPVYVRWSFYFVGIAFFLFAGNFLPGAEFYYAQF